MQTVRIFTQEKVSAIEGLNVGGVPGVAVKRGVGIYYTYLIMAKRSIYKV